MWWMTCVSGDWLDPVAELLTRPLTIVQPAFRWCPPRAYTYGPDVVEFGESLGIYLDAEQRMMLDDLYAVKQDDTPAALSAIWLR